MMIMMSSSKKCGGSREVVYDDVAQCETKSYDVVQKKKKIYTQIVTTTCCVKTNHQAVYFGAFPVFFPSS